MTDRHDQVERDITCASRGYAVERAGHPLYGAWVNAKTLGDATHTFTGAFTLVQGGLNLTDCCAMPPSASTTW